MEPNKAVWGKFCVNLLKLQQNFNKVILKTEEDTA